ncbi:MAG: hypothetical protein ACRD9R_09085, partial [Pyrinomonadaceae bacterium]
MNNPSPRFSPRRFQRALSFFLIICLAVLGVVPPTGAAQRAPNKTTSTFRLAAEDEAFLEDLSRRAFQYFNEHADPQTGHVLDRARTDGALHD